jgi:hypothetical protein
VGLDLLGYNSTRNGGGLLIIVAFSVSEII